MPNLFVKGISVTWFHRKRDKVAPAPVITDEEASLKELAGEGFPEKVSKAFQKAADEMNCVIWSRVPGKATTTAIDEGYNLKPFYIHGKSCDWGSMAGFACQLPTLNVIATVPTLSEAG